MKNDQIKVQATNEFENNSICDTIDIRYYQLHDLNHFYHEEIPDQGKEATRRYLLELYPTLIEIQPLFYNQDKRRED